MINLTAQQILDEINNQCLPHRDIRNGGDESEWAMVEVDGTQLDVEFWTEEQLNGDVLYRITAYPMSIKDGVYVGDYSQWLTLHSEIVT
jgi:hypothetical protein